MTGIAYQIIKILLTAIVIWLISYIGKRFTAVGAIVASLPLTSLLAIIWLYVDTGNVGTISRLSHSIFWMVLPSLVFFISLPLFLKIGFKFWLALGSSSLLTYLSYTVFIFFLTKCGIRL